jgi:membrane protein
MLLFNFKEIKSFFGHFVGGLYNRLDNHHVFLLAGGLAFSLFVCIIPFVLIIFAVLGNILERPSIALEIHSFIYQVIPYQDYAVQIEEFVFNRVNEFKIYKNLAGALGLVGLFIAASGLFSSMRTILNSIYHVVTSQHAVIGKLRDLGLVLLVMSYFLLSTTILPTLDIIGEFDEKLDFLRTMHIGFIQDLFLSGISLFIIFVAFFTLYYLVPQQKIPKKVIFVSALAAALMWETAKQAFGLYIANVATLKRVYGAYLFLIVSAFWIYYTSIVFIIGAEIGQLYREWRNRRTILGQ